MGHGLSSVNERYGSGFMGKTDYLPDGIYRAEHVGDMGYGNDFSPGRKKVPVCLHVERAVLQNRHDLYHDAAAVAQQLPGNNV